LPDDPRKMRGLFMRDPMMTDLAHTPAVGRGAASARRGRERWHGLHAG
jgi:hypothetical protein